VSPPPTRCAKSSESQDAWNLGRVGALWPPLYHCRNGRPTGQQTQLRGLRRLRGWRGRRLRQSSWNIQHSGLRSPVMIDGPPITHPPSLTPALAESQPVDGLWQRWARYESRVRELRREESAAAASVAENFQKHAGYYPAAVARNTELLLQNAARPDLLWAMERWAEIFNNGGLPLVLRMLANPESHQELLSSSPFYLMRPPSPENEFYQAYDSSSSRHH
jgi:hypothetical protein